MKKWAIVLVCFLMIVTVTVGYAQITGSLEIFGEAVSTPIQYDVYISGVTPSSSGPFRADKYFSTVLMSSVSGGGSGIFTVTVTNQSDKTYVFERIVGGAESGIDDIYSGEGISYTLSGLSFLDELAPRESLTFTVTIKAASGVVADNIYTQFKFILKTGTEILPDGETTVETETEVVEPEETSRPISGTVTETEAETEEIETETHMHGDMLGLSEALRSHATNCLNDSDVIWDAVVGTIDHKHRPDNTPALLHCMITSIKGGNMVNITNSANEYLKSGNIVYYILVPDETDENRMFLYMYYESLCVAANEGDTIETYFQVLTRDPVTEEWDENGTYKGIATVARLWAGGNKNDYQKTIDPRTWISTATRMQNND